ncbi:MAG: hypothetical protein J5741_07930 [Bacteroidales bacterium]|nr:hypothetical protein [Bacteroidales bacterium]
MCRRPKHYSDMPVVPSRWLPPKGYTAITLFGRVLMREDHYNAWSRRPSSKDYQDLCHHEWIHLRQAVSVHNSWFCYYVLYFWHYLKGRPFRYGFHTAYLLNPFELEAYLFEDDDHYAKDNEEGAVGWKKLAAYSPSFWRALMLDNSSGNHLKRTEYLKRVREFMADKW